MITDAQSRYQEKARRPYQCSRRGRGVGGGGGGVGDLVYRTCCSHLQVEWSCIAGTLRMHSRPYHPMWLQGTTGHLEQLPQELLKGQYLSMGKVDVANFLCSVGRHSVMWGLSFRAPQTKAAELNALFKDPAAAQVGAVLETSILTVYRILLKIYIIF